MRIAPCVLLVALSSSSALAAPALVYSEQGPEDDAARFVIAGRTLVSLPVSPGYEPRASVSPRGDLLAAVTLEKGRDRLRSGTLWRLALPSGSASIVDEHVSWMQRPIALDGGAIAYLKVTGLLEARPEQMKQGVLDTVVSEVKVAGVDGKSRALATDRSFNLFIAGSWKTSLVLYRVADEDAAIYLLPLGGGAMKKLATLEGGPFARDFSIRGDKLVFASLTPAKKHALLELDLQTGKSATLLELGENEHASPLTSGATLFFDRSSPQGEQLVSNDGAKTTALTRIGAPCFPLAANATELCFRRRSTTDQELWCLDLRSGEARRITTRGSFSVAGFGEAL